MYGLGIASSEVFVLLLEVLALGFLFVFFFFFFAVGLFSVFLLVFEISVFVLFLRFGLWAYVWKFQRIAKSLGFVGDVQSAPFG